MLSSVAFQSSVISALSSITYSDIVFHLLDRFKIIEMRKRVLGVEHLTEPLLMSREVNMLILKELKALFATLVTNCATKY
jgi:hypothetical protein